MTVYINAYDNDGEDGLAHAREDGGPPWMVVCHECGKASKISKLKPKSVRDIGWIMYNEYFFCSPKCLESEADDGTD